MKSIILLSVLLGLILLSTTQCSKEAKETDYRDAFIGDYNFTINAYHYDIASDSTFKDSLYNFSGNIKKSDDSPSAILLYYKPNFNTVGNISRDGIIEKIHGAGIGWNLLGTFKGVDRLYFYYGGLYTHDSVTGIRK